MPSAVGYQPTLGTDIGELQERITTTKRGSITSVQAIYVPAHDLTDFWRSGGDLRKWVAGYVVDVLKGTTHPDWMKVLGNARRELPKENE